MKRSCCYRFLAALVALIFLTQMTPVRILAAQEDNEATDAPQSVLSQVQEEAPVQLVGEMTESRTETEKHFRLSDGSFLAVQYGMPIHYEAEDGTWQDIDNSLTLRNGSYYANSGDVLTAFSENLSTGRVLTSSYGDVSVGMGLYSQPSGQMELQALNPETPDVTVTAQISEGPITDIPVQTSGKWTAEQLIPENLSAEVLYEEVYPDVDLRYSLIGRDIKEQIVVKSPKESYSYPFFLQTEGATPTLQADGSVIISKADGTLAYTIPAPWMVDAVGEWSNAVTYSLAPASGGYVLTVTADSGWMNAQDRIFPVYIDPTLTVERGYNSEEIYCVYCNQGTPNEHRGFNQWQYVGINQSAYEHRMFLHFSQLPTLPTGSVMVDASLNICQRNEYIHKGCTEAKIGLFEVTSPKPDTYASYRNWIYFINWNRQPTYDPTVIDYVLTSTATNVSYRSWDMTALVKKWYTQTAESGFKNYTVALAILPDSQAYSTSYYALPSFMGYGNEHPPILAVNYRSATGIEPYYSYTSLGAGNGGTAHIADATGQLKVARNLLGFSSTANPFALDMVYNSDWFTQTDQAAGQTQVTLGSAMSFGAGWTLNYYQKIYTSTNAALAGYLIYRDGDGTDHYFRQKSTETGSSNPYYDEDGLGLKITVQGSGSYTMTDENGNKWYFTGGLLTSTEDADGNKLLINYASGRIQTIARKNANQAAATTVATLAYDSAGKLTQATDYAGSSYTFTYSTGTTPTLLSIRKNNTLLASYAYQDLRLTSVTDEFTGCKLSFAYDILGRVTSCEEYSGSTRGGGMTFTYESSEKTVIRDYGNDQTPGNSDDLLLSLLFDHAGRTVGAYSTDSTGTTVLGASNAVYTVPTGDDAAISPIKNRTAQTASIGLASRQLMQSGSLEQTPPAWNLYSGTGAVVAEGARTGTKALKVTMDGTGQFRTRLETVTLAPGTYTYSAYVNSSGVSAFGSTGISLRAYRSESDYATGHGLTTVTGADTDGGWARIFVTFSVSTSGSYALEVLAGDVTGTFYLDDFQLEKADGPAAHNLLRNGQMESATGWTGGTFQSTGGLSGGTLRLDGAAYLNSKLSQTVNINLPGSQTYVLSGWAKANAVKDTVTLASDETTDTCKQFGLRAVLTYSDGSTESHYAPFCADVTGWQYGSLTIVPKAATKTVSTVTVECAYEKNVNTAFFDDLSLVREAAQTMRYDEKGNLEKVTTTGLQGDENTYNNEGSLIRTVTGGNGTFTYTYDTVYTRRLLSVSNGTVTQGYTYDGAGNVTGTTYSAANGTDKIQSAVGYTADGNRVASQTDMAGFVTQYAYDSANAVMWAAPTGVTNANGVTAFTGYDAYGRVTETGIANVAQLGYTYTGGRLSAMTRSAGQTGSQSYSFTYDGFGNTTAIRVGSLDLATYEYSGSLLTKQTYGTGQQVTFTYDTLGRNKATVFPNGQRVEYLYNGGSQPSLVTEYAGNSAMAQYLYTYDALGRLISSEKRDGSGLLVLRTSQGYDAYNRLVRQSWQLGQNTYGESYTYNNSTGMLSAMTTGNGTQLGFTYDNLLRLTSLSAGAVSRTYQYRNLENGNTTTQVSHLSYPQAGLSYSYGYDALGNISHYIETESEESKVHSYTYDSQGQLLTASDGTVSYTYTYDPVGNLQTASNGTASVSYTYGNANWQDLLTAFNGQPIAYEGQTYDPDTGTVTGTAASGNPISYHNGTRWTFGWQNGRWLTAATDGTVSVSYAYDTGGLRTAKTVGTQVHTYSYAGGKLLRETYGDTTLDFFYDSAGTPFALKHNGTTYYYVTNLQGDVLRILDETGTTVAAYTYDPWGKLLSATGTLAETNPLRYRGYYYDAETALYYLQSRYYDPTACRFLNADALASTGQEVLGSNMFAYCLNCPILFGDAKGTKAVINWRGLWRDNESELDEYAEERAVFKELKNNGYAIYKGVPVVRVDAAGDSAFTFGIIFMGSKSENPTHLRHEYGHAVHFQQIGPLPYIITVAIPSVTCYWINQLAPGTFNYYSLPWEYIADRLGDVPLNARGRNVSPKDMAIGSAYYLVTRILG